MTEVLVLRAEDEFSQLLVAAGLSVINCPVIQTEPMEDLSPLRNAVSRPNNFDGVFITSATAAKIFAECIHNAGYRERVFVLGRRSFDILKETATDVFFYDAANSAAEMLGAIPRKMLQGKRFLFVCGERSMRTIPELLAGIADIEEEVVYRTVNVAVADSETRSIRYKAAGGKIAMTCFFSPSGVSSFVEQFGVDTLRHTKLAAIGETTADALRVFDRKVDIVGESADRFAESVIQYFRPTGKGVEFD